MKLLTKVSACIVTIFLVLGCGDDFLNKVPKGQLSSENFWETEEQAMDGLTAAYSVLNRTHGRGYMVNNLYFGDIVSDDTEKGGGGANDRPDVTQLEEFNVTADNPNLESKWDDTYEGIVRANLVIANTPDIEMDQGTKDQIMGEAKFLRAFHYFHLLKVWREVPLITEVLDVNELKQPKSPRGEIWNQIETDLSDAIAGLPVDSDIGRVTRGAALALKAKAHLFQEEWQDALDNINTLQGLNKYSLDPNYFHNFRIEGENNEESIFEIQCSRGSGFFDVSAFYGPTAPRGGPYGCCGFNQPTEDFVNEFENGDPRLDGTVGIDGRIYLDDVVFDKSWASTTGHSVKKSVVAPSTKEEFGMGGWQAGPLNYKAIRYADVLLWKAEALNELGRTSDAEGPLNEVRERARNSWDHNPNNEGQVPPPDLLPDRTGLTQEEMRQAIIHERRVELGGEGHRFPDLVRWGIAAEVMQAHGKGFEEGKHEYFPIPQAELDLNPNLEQDPNY